MAVSGDERSSAAVILADRLAATLIHHEPGWRLPRPSALARRYNVRPADVEQAVRDLAARHLIRQLPDGQIYRASPAECLIPVHGVPELGACVDPMGGEITCRNRKVSWRRVPEDIGWALGVGPAESVCAIRCHWSVNSEPAAISTTYLTRAAATLVSESPDEADAQVAGLMGLDYPVGDGLGRSPATPLGRPAALHLEMQPPPSSVARGLRLTAGQPAITVTVRFDASVPGSPVALMVTAMRPDLFRIVVRSAADGGAGHGDAADRLARAGRCG